MSFLDAIIDPFDLWSKKKTRPSSPFASVERANSSSPFASGSTRIVDGVLKSDGWLNKSLRPAQNAATSGLGASLSYLNQNPYSLVNNVTSGQNPWFNTLEDQRQSQTGTTLGRALMGAARTGNQSSSLTGGALARVAEADAEARNRNILNALQFGDQRATGNANTFMGTINNLNALAGQQQSSANINFMNAMAQQQQQQQLNAQMAAQQQQQQQQALGTIAALGLTAATGGLAAPVAFGSLGAAGGGAAGASATPMASNAFQSAFQGQLGNAMAGQQVFY